MRGDSTSGLPVDAREAASSTCFVRAFIIVWLAVGLVSGCSTASPRGSAPSARSVRGSAASSEVTPPETGGRLDDRVEGRVTLFNPLLRYVVMDFPLRGMPALEQRLGVYRDGQRVGEVKISGPVRDTTVAGDVMVGEARVGDEVREE
jgi:hypothetical protein